MKKLIMLVLVLATTVAFAQEKRSDNAKKDWTPEQMAEKRTNKMASELTLTDAQKQRVYAINLEKAKDRKAKMEAGSEKRDEYKKQMKAILTDAQYASWMENKSKSKSNLRAKYKKNQQ